MNFTTCHISSHLRHRRVFYILLFIVIIERCERRARVCVCIASMWIVRLWKAQTHWKSQWCIWPSAIKKFKSENQGSKKRSREKHTHTHTHCRSRRFWLPWGAPSTSSHERFGCTVSTNFLHLWASNNISAIYLYFSFLARWGLCWYAWAYANTIPRKHPLAIAILHPNGLRLFFPQQR